MGILRVLHPKQKGFTLVELAIGLSVLGLLFAGVWRLIGNMNQQLQDQSVARQTRTILEAAINYTSAQRSNLLTLVPDGGWRAIGFTTETPPLPPLIPQYLPSGVSQTNAFGQTYRVLVRRQGNNLDTFVTATGATTPMKETRLIRLASLVGADGGAVRPDNPTTGVNESQVVTGAYGGWSMPVSDFTGSGVALAPYDVVVSSFYSRNVMTANYLYRTPGVNNPSDAHRMSVNIDMNGNGVDNLANITTAGMNITHPNGIGTPTAVYVAGEAQVERRLSVGEDILTSGNVFLSNQSLKLGCDTPFETCGSNKISISGSNGNINTNGSITAAGDINSNSTIAGANVNAVGAVTGATVTAGNITSNNDITFGRLLWVPTGGIIRTANIGYDTYVEGRVRIRKDTRNFPPSGAADLTVDGTINAGGDISTSGHIFANSTSGMSQFFHIVKIPQGSLVGESVITSDRALKKNIKPLKNSLGNLLKLRGVSFNLRKDNRRGIGFIAQEVEKVFPELVKLDEEEDVRYLNYDGLIGPIVEAIRELKADNDNLRNEIVKLKNEKLKKDND